MNYKDFMMCKVARSHKNTPRRVGLVENKLVFAQEPTVFSHHINELYIGMHY